MAMQSYSEVMLIPPCFAVLLASPMAVVGAVLVVIGWIKRRRVLWVGGLVFIGLSVAGAVIMAAVMMWCK